MATLAPNTGAIGDAIVAFLNALTYSDATPVYTLAQLEAIKDITDKVANGGVCVEVYCADDTTSRRGFGGRIWDPQSWLILTICSLDTAAYSRKIYDARDALVQPFQEHAELNTQVFNLFYSALQPNMKFGRILRNGVWYRSHLAQLLTKQEWVVAGGIQS